MRETISYILKVRSARLWENSFPQADTEKFNVLNLRFSLPWMARGSEGQPPAKPPEASQ